MIELAIECINYSTNVYGVLIVPSKTCIQSHMQVVMAVINMQSVKLKFSKEYQH